MSIPLRVLRLPHGAGLPLPAYQTPGSAGLDLPAAVTAEVVLEPGARALVPTGVAVEIPPGYEGQVRPRSGLAVRHGVTVANAPGTIDSDYRGEIKVALVNLGCEPFAVSRGQRVAQLVIAPVTRVEVVEVTTADALSDSERGAGGFGHTG